MLVRSLPVMVMLAALAIGDAAAIQRVHRALDEGDGLPMLPIYGLGQDSAGYLWLATLGGVGRYDGVRFRSWSERVPTDPEYEILAGTDGEVLAFPRTGALFRVAGPSMEPVTGPEGSPLDGLAAAAFGPDGALWVSRAGELLVRRHGDWSVVRAPSGMRIHLIAPLESGGALIATDTGVHRLASNGTATRLDPSHPAVRIRAFGDEDYAILLWGGTGARVVEFTDGERREHGPIPGRPIDVVRRGRTFWVATDRYLAAVRPGMAPELMGPEDGLPSGGPLHVDREGSLWLGTLLGLLHFPEPETILLNDRDGLPSSHARYFVRTDEGIWLATWQGSALIHDGPPVRVHRDSTRGVGRNCVDARGVLWSGRTDWNAADFAILERLASGEVEHRMDGFQWISGCAPASDGGLWMIANVGLLRSSPRGGTPVRVAEPPASARSGWFGSHKRAFEDSSGRLWLARGASICHADARATSITETSWSCDSIEGMRHATTFLEPSPGVVWMATTGGGVLRRAGSRWETIPASVRPRSADVLGLRASPSGGIWIGTHEIAQRVADRPDLPGGWEVLEELSHWHGLPASARQDVLELEDGTLWIATFSGVARVPAGARHPPGVPQRVEVAEVLVDGNHLAPEVPLTLPYARNRLELHFSALSYREPGRLRYRIRSGRDQVWSDPVEHPFIRLVDLSPGAHRIEVSASLDSTRWTPSPAVLELEVGRPWFMQTWFVGLAIVLIAAGVYGVHRARVASLLRLERQRARIARDLHDEMGSGLGSVGILAELASGDRLEEGRRQALSAQIAQTVGELGATLDDIVWSLRPGAQTLDALAVELAARGQRLFPDGKAAFRTTFPELWPDVRLSPEVRRNVERIAFEALHNAARHAMARTVSLALEPHGRRWRLSVVDDGNGLPADAAVAGNGLGLAGMRGRAEEIGALIAWESVPGGGTVVTLDFEPAAGRRRSAG